MTIHDIIDGAIEMARGRGADVPPGRLTEEIGQSILLEWADDTQPQVIRLTGKLTAEAKQWYDVPGYIQYVTVSLGGTFIYPVPDDHEHWNEGEVNYTGVTGFIVRDGKILFTAGESDDMAEGTEWVIIYRADNIPVPPESDLELYFPAKLGRRLMKEMAYEFRDNFGGEKLTKYDIFDRRNNEAKFRNVLGARDTASEQMIQPDPFWT